MLIDRRVAAVGYSARRIAIIGNQALSALNFRGPLIRDLASEGHRVFVLAPDYDDATRAAMRELGGVPVDYALDRASINPLKDLRSLFSLWRLLWQMRPDTVLCYFAKPVIYGSLAAWLAGVQRRVALIEGAGYAFAAEADGHVGRRLLRCLVSTLYNLALRRAHQVLVLNRDDHQLFAKLLPSVRLKHLPGIGVDTNAYPLVSPVLEPITFCLAARLIEEKGVRIYAQAARQIKSEYPQARFLLLGGVDVNPGALDLAEVRAWVAEGLIDWPGWVADVTPYLAKTSVFVLPSHYREGLPRSILEAMAMGRPVITTHNPGCREAVIDGECGYLVPVRDSGRLASAMRRFCEKPQLVADFGQAARRRVENFYDVRAVNRRMISILLPELEPVPALEKRYTVSYEQG